MLVTAFGLALATSAHQRDLVVGTAVSGRSPRTEQVVGCFASVAPLRLRFAASSSFAAAVARTHATVREALAHQHLSLDPLVDFGPDAFAAVFTFQNMREARLELLEVTATADDPVPVAPKYPFTVTVTADDTGYRVLAEIDSAALPEAAANAVLHRFRAILIWPVGTSTGPAPAWP